jgi:hypothetical protein
MASRRALVTFLCLAGSLPAQRGLNLLFYGNSYSIDNWTVPALVEAIVREAGHDAPRVVARLFGGTDLRFHRTDPAQVAAIHTSLPPGESWDFVVMQGLSLEPTHKGDPLAFRAHALGILHNVRAHSPAARAVLFQTWARGPGHGLYPGGFPNPRAMHTEVAQSYQLARADIDPACGPDTARQARVGDAVALHGFPPRHYTPHRRIPATT